MKWFREVSAASKEVYALSWYWSVTVITAVILFSLNNIIRNYKILVHDFSTLLLFSLIRGTFTSLPLYAIISLIFNSLLGGAVMAFSIFIIRRQAALGISTSITGIIVSIFAPACPACALSLLGILGLSGFLVLLPFKGIELGILGIVILVGSLVFLSKKINTAVCEVKE